MNNNYKYLHVTNFVKKKHIHSRQQKRKYDAGNRSAFAAEHLRYH